MDAALEIQRRPIEPFAVDWDRIILNEDELDSLDYWFRECSFTRDEIASSRFVVKRFPWDERPDIQTVMRHKAEHFNAVHQILASRKVMKTWSLSNIHLWKAIREQARHILTLSVKQERADYLVGRMAFLWNQLAKLDTNKHPPIAIDERRENKLGFSNGSLVEALTQAVTDVIMVTTSAILVDEAAYLKRDMKRKIIGAALPGTQGGVDPESGGSFTGVSSCNGDEDFYRLMFPTDEDAARRSISPWESDELRTPARGLQIWPESQSFYKVLWYYFADKNKMPATAWYRRERAKYPGPLKSEWYQQYEIWPLATTGREILQPVYNERHHRKSWEDIQHLYDPRTPVIVGWDIGQRGQCATAVQGSPRTRRILGLVQVLRPDMPLEAFVQMAMQEMAARLPGATFLHFGDPRTLSSQTGTLQGGFAEVMQRAGVMCAPAPAISVHRKIDLLKTVLSEYVDAGEPRFLFCGETCPAMTAAFRGKYCYKAEVEMPKRDGRTEHSMDSLAFALMALTGLASEDEEFYGGDEGDEVLALGGGNAWS